MGLPSRVYGRRVLSRDANCCPCVVHRGVGGRDKDKRMRGKFVIFPLCFLVFYISLFPQLPLRAPLTAPLHFRSLPPTHTHTYTHTVTLHTSTRPQKHSLTLVLNPTSRPHTLPPHTLPSLRPLPLPALLTFTHSRQQHNGSLNGNSHLKISWFSNLLPTTSLSLC